MDDDEIEYHANSDFGRGWYFLDPYNGVWVGPYKTRATAARALKELKDYRSNKRH